MTTLREAAQQALEMLEDTRNGSQRKPSEPVITALRAALAQQDASVEPVPLKRGKTGRCTRKVCECEKEGLGPECIYLEPVIDGYPLWSGIPKAEQAEPVQEQDIEDAIEAAYWYFDARRSGLNEWASAPQSERDAFKAEARKLARGYFPTRQAQDTKREMLAVADAFIRGKRAAPAEPVQEPVAWLQPKTVDGYSRPDLGYETCSSADYGAFPVYRVPPRCPNCASLEAQNNEFDRKLAEMERADLSRCPQCGGPADNGHDRSIPPNPYLCTKCMAEPVAEIIESEIKEDSHQTLDDALRQPRAMAQAYENGYKAGVAAEREECAKVCDFHVARLSAIDEPRPALAVGICAAAIRARGNT